ncbi:MAG: PEP-utilizing enzyme [archaeon]|jgi:pyruvate,water dikinase
MSEKKQLLTGICASKGIFEGQVHIASDTNLVMPKEKGFILVCNQTSPAYIVLLMNSRGVITEKGGMVSHPAIVSRELGIPCIVGASNATQLLKQGQKILLDATNGVVYELL